MYKIHIIKSLYRYLDKTHRQKYLKNVTKELRTKQKAKGGSIPDISPPYQYAVLDLRGKL